MTENERKLFLEWEVFVRNISEFIQISKIAGINLE